MKKNGFTLVELLGIIAILGILGGIIVVIVTDIIDDSEKDAALRSAEQIIKNVTINYTTNDNFTTDKLNILDYLNDKKIEEGYIQFNENEKVRLYMVYDGYCVSKTYDSELQISKTGNNEICDWSIVE